MITISFSIPFYPGKNRTKLCRFFPEKFIRCLRFAYEREFIAVFPAHGSKCIEFTAVGLRPYMIQKRIPESCYPNWMAHQVFFRFFQDCSIDFTVAGKHDEGFA